MATNTFQAVVRSGPKGHGVNAGSVVLALPISFDPTAASADSGIVIPKGAIVLGFQHDGGATGGTNPTFDIGTSSDADAFINEGDADAAGYVAVNGAEANTAVSEDTAVYVGVGASAATGGTVAGMLLYVREDSTSGVNE